MTKIFITIHLQFSNVLLLLIQYFLQCLLSYGRSRNRRHKSPFSIKELKIKTIELIYKKHWLLSLKIRNYVLCIMLVVPVQRILQSLSLL